MHDAGRQGGGRVHRCQRFRHAFEAVADGDEDVGHPTRLEVVEHLHPELGAFGIFDPQTQDVARAIGQHGQGQVDRLVAHQSVFAGHYAQRIEEHHRIHRLERSVLPSAHFGHDLIGDGTDQVGTHVHGVYLAQVCLDLAHGHAACVHRDDPVVKAGEPALVLADDLRLEGSMTVARHLDAQRSIVGQDGLAAAAVAVIEHAFRLGPTRLVAKAMRHLGAEGTLAERLLEPPRDGFGRFRGHRASDQMVE